jgi:hypothetical protein
MLVYLVKDIKESQRVEFSKIDIQSGVDHMKSNPKFKRTQDRSYRGSNGQYVGLNSTQQIHLHNIDDSLLEALIKVVGAKYYMSSEITTPQPIEELIS